MLTGLKKTIGQVISKLKLALTDILLLLGAGLVFYGVYRIYEPAAFILIGTGLIYWAIQLERGKPNGRNR